MVNDLPYFAKEMPAGDVRFINNAESFANASMIGYAASVDYTKKMPGKTILRKIMHNVKQCCLEQSFHKVNIPLLGTGAGGLSPQDSYDVMRSEFKNETDIILCIYAFSAAAYNDIIIDDNDTNAPVELKNPRVFISYTGTDYENRTWVKNFACRLRENGVDARVDIFHLKPGQDLPQWMTNELMMADKVLLICDKYYADKADNRKGGVGWETMIIQGDMLSEQEQNKYIAILRNENIDQSLPIYVKSRFALDWSDDRIIDREFTNLLLYLFDCDIEPPIGSIPFFVKEKLAK